MVLFFAGAAFFAAGAFLAGAFLAAVFLAGAFAEVEEFVTVSSGVERDGSGAVLTSGLTSGLAAESSAADVAAPAASLSVLGMSLPTVFMAEAAGFTGMFPPLERFKGATRRPLVNLWT
ncbi:hypothetical protein GCM10009710_11400 [Aeromicrobium alkaliterrae]|uniref:Secreted protein n=1 Tax=Aeromicrobium alkaliterrae TaxID=302168 RepID=A0ABN2JMK4_9ACTN